MERSLREDAGDRRRDEALPHSPTKTSESTRLRVDYEDSVDLCAGRRAGRKTGSTRPGAATPPRSTSCG
ncbi:hypothetical protein HMPREF9057_01026 [Actinomyces sp. oral taxon 171 str. F0337]|nr:hypothetical protein HMPREF9057_01026 [Actinomyces sp. oral taxon 171 str. F0337]